MKHLVRIVAFATIGVLVAGCATNGSSVIPGTTQANLATNKLQLAVGTAFNANDGSTGLNIVTTFRQPNGNSAVAADNVSITGPFTVPSTFPPAYGTGASADAGTHAITSSPQVPRNVTPINSTLGTFTGAFSYGLAPLNSDQQNVLAYYPGNPNTTPGNGFNTSNLDPNGTSPWWPLPIGAKNPGAQSFFLLGPPAVPFFNNGTYPVNFAGYSPGFTVFAVPPVAGAYSETVNVVAANAPTQTFTASTALANTAPLGAPTVSALTKNGGGFTGSVTAAAGTSETLVFIADANTNHFYTVGPFAGSGTFTFTLPATLGSCNGAGCQNGASATPSIAYGDTYVVSPVSFDYPAFEAAPPANTQQTPTIAGASGQADLAIGLYQSGTY